jgi:hypothetical protein
MSSQSMSTATPTTHKVLIHAPGPVHLVWSSSTDAVAGAHTTARYTFDGRSLSFGNRTPRTRPSSSSQQPPPKKLDFLFTGTGKSGHAWSPDPPNPVCTPAPSVLRLQVVRRPIAHSSPFAAHLPPPARATLPPSHGGHQCKVLMEGFSSFSVLDCVFCGSFCDSLIATTTAAIRRKTTTTMGTTNKNV